MKTIIALSCAGWLAAPGAPLTNNIAPLAFGMTPQDVATALGTSLAYVSGRRDAEIYYAVRPARMPGFFPVDKRIYLQFRKGCLTGWKSDWRLRPSPLL